MLVTSTSTLVFVFIPAFAKWKNLRGDGASGPAKRDGQAKEGRRASYPDTS